MNTLLKLLALVVLIVAISARQEGEEPSHQHWGGGFGGGWGRGFGGGCGRGFGGGWGRGFGGGWGRGGFGRGGFWWPHWSWIQSLILKFSFNHWIYKFQIWCDYLWWWYVPMGKKSISYQNYSFILLLLIHTLDNPKLLKLVYNNKNLKSMLNIE